MNRILISLGSFSLVVMAAALLLGLAVEDLYDAPDEQALRWATVHRLTGTAAALAVVLVECIVVTYFIGTSRWCREVVETYQLDPAPADASGRLKRRAFPWAMAGMLTVIVVGALGAAGDPANGAGQSNTEPWAQVHLLAALAGWALVAWTYWAAWSHVVANQAIIDAVMTEVARVRQERGLDR
jgi:hypothetical protein